MPVAGGLYYEWAGNPDGEVLLLSAGLGGASTYWEPNLAAFGERYRLLLYDHRGTGRSDRTLPMVVTVDDLVNYILTVLDATRTERAHLLGHAAGGVAGLAAALKAPERVRKLIVVNGWAHPDPHFARCFDARLSLLRDSGPEAYLRAQPLFLYPASWISAHHRTLEAELPHQLAAFAGADAYEKRIAALRAFNITRNLGEIVTPTLVLASRDDMLVPYTMSEWLAASLPSGQIYLMEWGGHACNVTDADTFETLVLDFLRR